MGKTRVSAYTPAVDPLEQALADGWPPLAVGAAAERAGLELGSLEAVVVELVAQLSGDPVARARARHLELLVSQPQADELATHEALMTEAAAVEGLDVALASRIYADAAIFAARSDPAASLDAAERSSSLAERDGGASRVYARLGFASAALANGHLEPAAEIVRDGLGDIGEGESGFSAVHTLQIFSALFYYLEDYASARLVLERALAIARRERVRGDLAIVLDTLGAIDLRLGRYSSALAKSLEALRIAREDGESVQAASCLTTLAAVDAIQGRERRCRERVEEASALVPGDHIVHAWGFSAIALLLLGLGRVAEVAELAPRVDAAFAAVGAQPASEVTWLNLLVESLVRLGRVEDAQRALERLIRAAAGTGTGWDAVTARCRGLVAHGAESFEWFEHALELHHVSPRPFERARTELCYGEALRRARRRAQGRLCIESSLATFQRLRATPWAERARRELGATEPPRRGRSPSELLTPHEREVAALVSHGATNREAAAALFVTTKTIERHLTSVYSKLGIRSRTELTRLLLAP